MGPITQAGGSPEGATAEATTPADLAEASRLARECDALVQAVTLARWIEEKPRPVTPSEMLRKADVQAAGAVLGIPVPAKLRTAADIPALHLPWLIAVAAGLIQVSDGEARGGPALEGWPPADDELLAGWLAAFRAACAAGSKQGRPDRADLLALGMLVVLARGNAPSGQHMWPEVAEAVRDMFGFSIGLHARALDAAIRFSGVHSIDPVPGLFAFLATFGAVTTRAGRPQLTVLGRWVLGQLQAGLPVPVRTSLPAGDLLARLAAFGGDADRRTVARDWVQARSAQDAVREILAAADQASPSLRLLAIGLADALDDDDETLPVWEEMTRAPRVGPYARAVVTAFEEEMPEADRRWIAVDWAAASLADDGPDEALTYIFETFPGSNLDDRLAAVRATTHPDAETLARSLSEFAASGAPRSIDQVVQIKVTLTRWRPAIWRRVLVSAASTLGDLHHVIQILYGWDGAHMHRFEVGNERYSDAVYGLEDAADEDELRLPRAFGPDVKKITYTYDFGRWWAHEITLERRVERQQEQAYPVCVAFQGDSPVEYEDEDEPEPFSLTRVNDRLRISAIESALRKGGAADEGAETS